MLVAAGADMEAEDRGGQTALELATERGHAEIVTVLRAAGARRRGERRSTRVRASPSRASYS